jgi:hypothetical protein
MYPHRVEATPTHRREDRTTDASHAARSAPSLARKRKDAPIAVAGAGEERDDEGATTNESMTNDRNAEKRQKSEEGTEGREDADSTVDARRHSDVASSGASSTDASASAATPSARSRPFGSKPGRVHEQLRQIALLREERQRLQAVRDEEEEAECDAPASSASDATVDAAVRATAASSAVTGAVSSSRSSAACAASPSAASSLRQPRLDEDHFYPDRLARASTPAHVRSKTAYRKAAGHAQVCPQCAAPLFDRTPREHQQECKKVPPPMPFAHSCTCAGEAAHSTGAGASAAVAANTSPSPRSDALRCICVSQSYVDAPSIISSAAAPSAALPAWSVDSRLLRVTHSAWSASSASQRRRYMRAHRWLVSMLNSNEGRIDEEEPPKRGRTPAAAAATAVGAHSTDEYAHALQPGQEVSRD